MMLKEGWTYANAPYLHRRPARVLRSWGALVEFHAIRRNASHLPNPVPQPQPPAIQAPIFKLPAAVIDESKKTRKRDKVFQKFLKVLPTWCSTGDKSFKQHTKSWLIFPALTMPHLAACIAVGWNCYSWERAWATVLCVCGLRRYVVVGPPVAAWADMSMYASFYDCIALHRDKMCKMRRTE